MSPPVPRSMQDMTPAWLTQALGPHLLDGAVVTDTSVTSLSEGVGFIGEVSRIELIYDDRPDGAPTSLVAKIPIGDTGGKMLGIMLRLYEREAAFYASMASKVRVRVPRCFHNSSDVEAGDFCLLLEDLGHLETIDQRVGASVREATNILQTIARFHARWEGARGAEFDWLPAADDPMMVAFINRYEQAREKLVTEMPDLIDPETHETALRLSAFKEELLAGLAQLPATINHGDFRLDNMFFDHDEVVLFDWQGMTRTSPLNDVVYFLGTNISPEILTDHHESLLSSYADALADAGGPSISLDEMMSNCQQLWATFLLLGTVLVAELDFTSEQGIALFAAANERSINAARVFDVHRYEP